MPNQFYSKLARCLAAFLCVAALASALNARAASREDNDYRYGTNVFANGFFRQAEMTFSNFIIDYPDSPRLTNALVYLARSKIGQSNYSGALALMKEKLPADDPAVLNYVAQAYYGAGNYTNAAASCTAALGKLTAGDPSILGLARLQAQAESKLRNWPRVIALLSTPDGIFQRAARVDTNNVEVVSGTFLLSEAYLNEQRYDEAESAVRQVKTNSLPRALQWRRDYLLCRILLDAGRAADALTNSAELTALSAGPSDTVAATFLRGEILERLSQPTNALAEYEKNLAPALPPDVNRTALAKIMSLAQPTDAIPQLDTIIARRPFDPNLDLALWYRGDLYLKTYFTPATPDTNSLAPGNTNDLQAAVTNLSWLVQSFTNSEVLGQAALDLGWCDWAQEKFADAKTNFLLAVTHLPYSANGAVALLKLADAQFKVGEFNNAARHYDQLLTDYAAMPAVTNQLFATALYQLVQADLDLHDEKGSETAAARLVNDYRDSGFGASGLLLLGENASRFGDYARAREIFSNLLADYPNTPLQPKIQFAIARTYEHEGDWSNAVRVCELWLANTNFTTNDLLPEVAFTRALDTGKAGLATNALALMTDYVTQFQSNSLASKTFAPFAQFWIGEYHRNRGDNSAADYAYQYLWATFPLATNVTFQARLMAGRAAEAYDLPQASSDFLWLTDNTNTPAAVLGEAWFQLGYTAFLQFQAGQSTPNQALFTFAVGALGKAANADLYPTLAPEAFGQLGNCWLAWAPLDKDPADKAKDYAKAGQMYEAELNLPQSDITARSQAEFGLGLVAQGLHHPDEALDHFLKVVFTPSEVIDEEREKPDPHWVKEAGVAAWQMCEDKKDYANAAAIYARVKAVVPTLDGEMEEKKVATAVIAPSTSN